MMTSMRSEQGLVAVCALACLVASSCNSGEPAADSESAAQLKALVEKRGAEYIAARADMLRQDGAEKLIEALKQTTKDTATRLLCEALVYRLKHPETSQLIDEYGPCPGVAGLYSSPSGRSDDLGGNYPSNNTIIASCFGSESFPIFVEHLLYEGRPTKYRLDLVLTLVELRDDRVCAILTSIASAKDEEANIRASATWRLGQCLAGLPALRTEHGVGKGPVGIGVGFGVQKAIADMAKPVSLPALKLTGQDRDTALALLTKLLAEDKNERIRAVAARALQYGGNGAVENLVRAMTHDTSPWVRSWCAVALSEIGGHAANEARRAAAVSEKNDEVKTVLLGKAAPLKPEDGVPKNSILAQ